MEKDLTYQVKNTPYKKMQANNVGKRKMPVMVVQLKRVAQQNYLFIYGLNADTQAGYNGVLEDLRFKPFHNISVHMCVKQQEVT